jgi:hypothetical protein
MLTRSTETIRQMHAVEEQIEKISHDASGRVRESLEEVEKKLKAMLGTESTEQPAEKNFTLSQLNTQAAALYRDVDSADAAPTAAQVAAIAKMRSDFSSTMDLWSGLKAVEFAALNRKLTATNLPEIRFDLRPTHEEDEDDQDLE